MAVTVALWSQPGGSFILVGVLFPSPKPASLCLYNIAGPGLRVGQKSEKAMLYRYTWNDDKQTLHSWCNPIQNPSVSVYRQNAIKMRYYTILFCIFVHIFKIKNTYYKKKYVYAVEMLFGAVYSTCQCDCPPFSTLLTSVEPCPCGLQQSVSVVTQIRSK